MFEKLVQCLRWEAYFLQVAAWISLGTFVTGLVVGAILWHAQRKRCSVVCSGLHDKPEKLWGLVGDMTIGRALAGLVAYFFWLPVLAMNSLFAGALFDIIFVGGKRIEAPWAPEAGKYYASALTAACLLAVLESFTAILVGVLGRRQRDQAPQKRGRGFDARAPLFAFLGAMVLFETGLAIWRSLLMSAGQVGLPTVWEGVLTKGWLVAGAMGFIVPVGEMVLAYVLADWFVTPWIAVTLGGGLWGLAGWHAPVPDAVSRLHRESGDLERGAGRLQSKVSRLNRRAAGTKQPRSAGEVEADVSDIAREVDDTRADWVGMQEALRSRLSAASPPPGFESIRQEARTLETRVRGEHRNVVTRIRILAVGVRGLPKACRTWNALCMAAARAEAELPALRQRVDKCREHAQDLQALLGWDGAGAPPATPSLGGREIHQITTLLRDSRSNTVSQAVQMVNQAISALGRADAALVVSGQLLHGPNALTTRFRAEAPVPTPGQVATWLGALANLTTALRSHASTTIRNLQSIGRTCNRKRPWWRRLLEAFLPSWLFGRDELPPPERPIDPALPAEAASSRTSASSPD